MHTLENGNNFTPRKMPESAFLKSTISFNCTPFKMTKWKMHTLEIYQKITHWNLIGNVLKNVM